MIGTDQELDIILSGDDRALELRNVMAVDELHSANGIHITTRQNNIWIDASHVSAMWQARVDLDSELSDDFIPSRHNRLTTV
jgi:pectate lyase